MNQLYREFQEYMQGKQIFNSHCHHLLDYNIAHMTFDNVLRGGYIGGIGYTFEDNDASKEEYLKKVRYNSYFLWLEKGCQELYGINEPITVANWGKFAEKTIELNKDPQYHLNALTDICHYENILLDTYWNPGGDNNHPEVFQPVYRINMWLFGYNKEGKDHNNNNPMVIYGEEPETIDEYVEFMKRIIRKKLDEGCVALKCPVAYDRGLDFDRVTKEQAQKAMNKDHSKVTEQDIKNFQDYIFWQIADYAAEINVTYQVHTGLGLLRKSNALQMREVIEAHKETKFALLHCGYPWMDDINGLLHNCTNVYPDLCWLPLISPSASVRMLHEMIEVGSSDKFCWGCDTWTQEESMGALIAIRHVLARVMAERVEEGYFNKEDAHFWIDNILYNNGKKLYNL